MQVLDLLTLRFHKRRPYGLHNALSGCGMLFTLCSGSLCTCLLAWLLPPHHLESICFCVWVLWTIVRYSKAMKVHRQKSFRMAITVREVVSYSPGPRLVLKAGRWLTLVAWLSPKMMRSARLGTSHSTQLELVDGCLWMFMDVDGCWWMFMDVYGCLWMFMDVDFLNLLWKPDLFLALQHGANMEWTNLRNPLVIHSGWMWFPADTGGCNSSRPRFSGGMSPVGTCCFTLW